MDLLPGQLVAVLVAVGAVAVWFGLLGVLVVATRSPTPRPGPPADPRRPDAESPAVVDLLTGGWRLCEEAAAATLLDLAARRAVTIEQIGPELSLVRLGRGEVSGLRPYELRVYEHLRGLARDGVVATGALAEGTRHLGSWWKNFTGEVIEESRALGLSQKRWSPWHRTVLSVASLLPAALVGLAVFVSPGEDSAGASFGAGLVVYAVLVSVAEKLNGERGTDHGVEVAGRWLGVREQLAAGRFAEQPAAAVTIWGRPLAYAAALGLAPRAVASLPVASPADDRRAWSDYGGMWHAVQVRYRARGLLGLLWGRTAWGGIGAAVLIGLGTFVLTFVALLIGGYLLDHDVGNPVSVARIVAVLVAAAPLVMALTDLFSRPSVQGQVVRKRRYPKSSSGEETKYHHWIAIDQGTSRELHAFGIDEDGWHRLEEGDVVSARIGRRLGRIYEVVVTVPSGQRR